MGTNLDFTKGIGLNSILLSLFKDTLVSQLPRISCNSSRAGIHPRLLLCIFKSCVPF